MPVPLSQLGVRGDRGTPDGLRLELVMADTPAGWQFVALDGDGEGVGNFARVYRGRLRFGGFELPVAVKVQRDNALVREQSESVAAKFGVEFAVHLKLADRDPGDGGGVVRPFAFALPSDQPATLPPAILCPHARHALAPLCPTCRRPLAVEEWVFEDTERVLKCDFCPGNIRYPATARDRLLKASVRQSGACDGCPKSDAECAAAARWLRFFPARALAFELLEIDLEDFLRGRFGRTRHPRHQAFWRRADAARAEYGPGALGQLGEALDLFTQLVAGVATLHRAGVAHLDLKPRNVCLTDDAGQVRLKVIDLGFATDPAGLALLYQSQTRVLDSEYAAPEVRGPVSRNLGARLGKVGNESVIVLDRVPIGGRDVFDPLVLAGDEVTAGESRGRVRRVIFHESGAMSLAVEWSGPAPTQFASVDVFKTSGPPADLFSLGLMLLGLTLGETDLSAARAALPQWLAALGNGSDESLSPRRVAERLFRAAGQSPAAADLETKLNAAYGEFAPVAAALVGIALRLLFRSPSATLGCYLRHRGDDAGAALRRLTEDVRAARAEWAALVAQHRADAERAGIAAAVRALIELVRQVPVGPVDTGRTQPFDAVLLRSVARAVDPADDASVRGATAELLEKYRSDMGRLGRHLRKLIDDPAAAATGTFDGRVLFEMQLFADPNHFRATELAHVRGSAEKVAQFLKQKSPTEATRAQLEAWLQRAVRVLTADHRWDDRQRVITAFVAWADALLAPPGGRARGRRALDLRLTRANRPPVPVATADQALDELELLRKEVVEVHWAALERRWAAAAKAWDALPLTVRSPLHRTRTAAAEAMTAAQEKVLEADRRAGDSLRRLRGAVGLIDDEVLRPWDAGLARRWNPLRDRNRPLWLRLSSEALADYEAEAPTAALKGLSRQRTGPATAAYLAALMDELRDIQLAENAGRAG